MLFGHIKPDSNHSCLNQMHGKDNKNKPKQKDIGIGSKLCNAEDGYKNRKKIGGLKHG